MGAQGNPENSYVFQVGVFVLRRVACSWTIWTTLNIECKKTTTPKNLMIYHHQFPQDYSFRLFMDIRNFGETQMFIKVFPLKLSLADEFVTIALKRPARAACLQNIATRGISLCLFSDCWFYHCSTMFYHALPEMPIKRGNCLSFKPSRSHQKLIWDQKCSRLGKQKGSNKALKSFNYR
jgi:hypothetical protein